MKKLVILFSVLLFVVSSVSAATADSVQKSITIDGDISDWSGVSDYSISEVNTNLGVPSSSSDLSGSFRSAWDSNYAYFLIEVTDEELDTSSSQFFSNNDGVEIMLDGGNEKSTTYDSNDVKVLVLADGSDFRLWNGSHFFQSAGNVDVSASQNSSGYVLEVGIDWSLVGGQNPSDGATYGFDLAVNDRDSGAYEHQLMWRFAPNHARDASGWGDLLLSGSSTSSSYSFSPSNLDFTDSSMNTLGVSISDTVIYDTGYYSTDGGTDWTQFSLSGSKAGSWVLSSASASISLNLADVNDSGSEMVAFYACTWVNGWDCHGNNWQIKSFDVTLPEPSTGPVCDNGVLESGEDCDGANFGGETCQTQGFDNGSLSCTSSCSIDTSGCYNNTDTAVCGDGVIEGNEECEPGNLAGETCSSQGYDSGSLSCDSSTCKFDTSSCFVDEGSLEADYQALQDFYYAMDGPNWDDNTGWESMTPNTMGDAFGVIVYPDGHEFAGRVKELGLSGDPNKDTKDIIGNGLSGDHIPDSFGNLKKLTHLRLKGNDITARIDNWIQGLTSAVKLSLSNSQDITGQTNFGYEDQTQYNHPSKSPDAYNLWQGQFPDDLSMLTQLELLEIGNAELTGSLPTHLPDSIVAFVAGNNHLSGTLPKWENAVRMTHLYLQNRYDREGQFTGPVPAEWNNMKDMAWFIINHNKLSGDFPEMGNWRDLEQFLIGGNDFTGTEPSHWLFNETDKSLSIDEVGVGGNAWDTEVSPYFLPNKRGPMYVYSNYNNEPDQTGMIPKWIGEKNTRQLLWSLNAFTHFEEGSFIPARNKLYWFDRNNISGNLPPIQTPWDSPQFRVRFWDNNFSGTIPNWSDAARVADVDVYIHLHNNLLEGEIPEFLGDFVIPYPLTVQDNKFTPKDILPHRAHIESGTSSYTYLPQKPFGRAETVSVGSVIDRSSFDYTGNQYQWFKDGSALSGETSPTINTGSYGAGTYVLEIEHPDIAFTFESEPITVN